MQHNEFFAMVSTAMKFSSAEMETFYYIIDDDLISSYRFFKLFLFIIDTGLWSSVSPSMATLT